MNLAVVGMQARGGLRIVRLTVKLTCVCEGGRREREGGRQREGKRGRERQRQIFHSGGNAASVGTPLFLVRLRPLSDPSFCCTTTGAVLEEAGLSKESSRVMTLQEAAGERCLELQQSLASRHSSFAGLRSPAPQRSRKILDVTSRALVVALSVVNGFDSEPNEDVEMLVLMFLCVKGC